MPSDQITSPGKSPRRTHLDAPALLTTVLAALAALGCIVMGGINSYQFVVLLLDRGQITARNAELFAAFGWLAGALVLILACGLLLRLMYRINGTAAVPAAAVAGPPEWRARRAEGAWRRR